MPPLNGPRRTRVVNTDIAEPATCDFGRVEEPGHHGSANSIGATDEPFTGIMRHCSKQPLMVIGLNNGHSSWLSLPRIGAGRQGASRAPQLRCIELENLDGTAGA